MGEIHTISAPSEINRREMRLIGGFDRSPLERMSRTRQAARRQLLAVIQTGAQLQACSTVSVILR